MSFLNPWAFAWLGLAAPVIALYFLKLKRKKVKVPSTWLWERSLSDLRVNAPFQKLRKSILLFLQLLLIALGALALTQPTGRAASPDERRVVLLIDRSASMQMKDVAPSRLDKAKELAKQIAGECGPREEIMVIAFSNRAQVMSPFTANRTSIERAIDAIQPVDSVTRIQEAYRIAASAVEGVKRREIVILSDGRFEAIQSASDAPVRYVPVGVKARNAAITAIDVRKPAQAGTPWTVFAQIDLFHDQQVEFNVELYVNGALKSVKKVTAPPNASAPVIFEVTKPEPDVVQVNLDYPDDLDVDNRAWFVVRRDPAKVLLATTGNFFLEKALVHGKDVDVFRTEDFTKASLGDYEVVVLDCVMPDVLPEGRYLIFGGVPKWEGIEVKGELAQPPVLDWNRRHPVTRMVNLSELFIKSSPKVTLPGYATALVETADAPLIFVWEKGRTRAVVITFKLLESDWPLRLSFPLFLVNALDWLREDAKEQPKPGEPLRLELSEKEKELEVVGPTGTKVRLTGEPGRDVVYGDTDRVGLYSVMRGDKTHPVAINLIDPQESRGEVAKEIRVGQGTVSRSGAPPRPAQPYWRWLAAGVLAILLAEWFVYHRRLE